MRQAVFSLQLSPCFRIKSKDMQLYHNLDNIAPTVRQLSQRYNTIPRALSARYDRFVNVAVLNVVRREVVYDLQITVDETVEIYLNRDFDLNTESGCKFLENNFMRRTPCESYVWRQKHMPFLSNQRTNLFSGRFPCFHFSGLGNSLKMHFVFCADTATTSA